MKMQVLSEALMCLKRQRLKGVRTLLNERIKHITTETELRKLMEELNKYEWALDEINKQLVEVEQK